MRWYLGAMAMAWLANGCGDSATQPSEPAAGPVTEGQDAGSSDKPSGRDAGSSGPRDASAVPPADATATAADAGSRDAVDAASNRADGGPSGPGGPAAGGLPSITDAWQKGPFTPTTQSGAGTTMDAVVYYPTELGQGGITHPIVIWDDGAALPTTLYDALLQHLASHGFVVYAPSASSDTGPEILAGIDWMHAENARSGSPYFGKLDETKLASMGHSRGSLATFAVATDPRIKSTIHLSGGTNPGLAQGHAALDNLRHPAAFICGPTGGDGLITGDVAADGCKYDFDNAKVPVFFATIANTSHLTAPGMTSGACVGWLRWQLLGDASMKPMFVGADCSLCTRMDWTAQERGLDALP